MPRINSQIQRPVIPWVLWTVCDYENTAEDKTAIHLKLYIFIPMTPTPPHWNNANYECPHYTWWVLGLGFDLSFRTVPDLTFFSALYYWMQYFIISHFSFHAQHAKKFWWWQWCWRDSKPNFLQVLVILSLHCALSCLKSCSMIW